MYCVRCGVKLADTEKVCPLCNTTVYHPDIQQEEAVPLYPKGTAPKAETRHKALSGALLILTLIPLTICFLCDLQANGRLDWFGLVCGAILTAYVTFALPRWFCHPNPVIFTPCSFAAVALYLLYINYVTEGVWFLRFALPATGGLGLIVCTVVSLTHYLKKGKLYIYGGAFMALGLYTLLLEQLLIVTFSLPFFGWSLYPLIALFLLGCLLLYFAVNPAARATIEQKLFF